MKVEVINGLRGYAILAVIYHHLFSRFTGPGYGAVHVGELQLLPFAPLANGWVGVNLFFILSGFVLFLPYASGGRSMDDGAAAWTFFKRRARRLIPLFYLCTFVGMLQFWSNWSEEIGAVIRNALLMLTATFNFTVDMWMPKYNFVLWSLGIEIWFSLVFPILILLNDRIGPYKLFAFVAVLALATRVMAMDPYIIQYDNIYLNPVKDSFIARLDDFVLGMVLASVYVRSRGRTLSRGAAFACAGGGLVALYVALMVWDYICLGMAPEWLIPYTNNFIQLGSGLLIFALLHMEANAFRRLFDNAPLQLIGMMCYSLYVWHVLVIPPVLGPGYTVERLIIYTLILGLVSTFTYRYVEFYYIRDGRSLFRPVRRNRDAQVPEPAKLSN